VLPMGVASAGARPFRFAPGTLEHYASIYDIVARGYPDLPAQARPITRREAEKTLVLPHLENVVAATRDEVFRALNVLGWTRGEFDEAVGALIETGRICEVSVSGYKGMHLVSKSAMDAKG
jgi:hypothetical protein